MLLLVLWQAAGSLPGAQTEVLDGLRVLAAVRLGLAIMLLMLTVGAVAPFGLILSYYAVAAGAGTLPRQPSVVASVHSASVRLAQLLALVIIWRVADSSLPIAMTARTLRQADWLPTAVTLVLVAALLILAWYLYAAARPLFDHVTLGLSNRLAGTIERKCAQCGAVNTSSAQFCGACGHALSEDAAPSELIEPKPTSVCSYCGAENLSDSRFCASCGKPVAS